MIPNTRGCDRVNYKRGYFGDPVAEPCGGGQGAKSSEAYVF